jgi:hypothetical protein
MTIEEIFGLLAQHMIKGMMVHAQMADYFRFLGLEGYAECHEYHYLEESKNYRELVKYYTLHYNKLILDLPIENPHIIPDDWGQFTRYEVTPAVRKNAISIGFDKWMDWEQKTKKVYEGYCKELYNLGEIASMKEIEKFVEDVNKEIAEGYKKIVSLKSIDYDISNIYDEQGKLQKKFYKKIKEIEYA